MSGASDAGGMGDDEWLAGMVGAAIAVAAAGRWYLALFRVYPVRRRVGITAALAATPPLCLAGLAVVLETATDPQVRGHPAYVGLFLVLAVTWMAAAVAALPFVAGVGVRDDAVERRNPAAAVLAAASLAAVTVVFTGANVGTGATIWTTLWPAAMATAALLLLWLGYGVATDVGEAVAVGRDPAAAVRAGGVYLAAAVVLARAVAGDYVSAADTASDFARRGWPAVAVVVAGIGVERYATGRRSVRRAVVVAAALIALGGVAALTVGRGPPR